MAAMADGLSLPLDPGLVGRIREGLTSWYAAAARDLPWRRTGDAYAIWVSEVMLQQTQVATVLPYYEGFMARFPTLETLAGADEQAVLAAWAGLGYYSRARALHRGARAVLAEWGGQIPRLAGDLLRLPGVGSYTANAIATLAFGARAAVVDGNVERVICRLFSLRGDPRRGPLRRRVQSLAEQLVDPQAPGEFNSAMMELGATVCRPARPECPRCPLRDECRARQQDVQDRLPELAPRPRTTPVRMVAGIVRRGDAYLLVQRPPGERWAGMWQFPNGEIAAHDEPRAAVGRLLEDSFGLVVEPGRRAAVVRHSVTRYRITLAAYHCELLAGEARSPAGQALDWAPSDRLRAVPLPAAHRRLASLLEQGEAEEPQLELALAS